jgi:hypothetical protein
MHSSGLSVSAMQRNGKPAAHAARMCGLARNGHGALIKIDATRVTQTERKGRLGTIPV